MKKIPPTQNTYRLMWLESKLATSEFVESQQICTKFGCTLGVARTTIHAYLHINPNTMLNGLQDIVKTHGFKTCLIGEMQPEDVINFFEIARYNAKQAKLAFKSAEK